jgi:hypothetical protein
VDDDFGLSKPASPPCCFGAFGSGPFRPGWKFRRSLGVHAPMQLPSFFKSIQPESIFLQYVPPAQGGRPFPQGGYALPCCVTKTFSHRCRLC